MINSTTTHITFLLCDRMLATSSTLPMEMLLAAESQVRSLTPQDRRPRLTMVTAAATAEPVITRTGLRWQADQLLAEVPRSDIVYIPGLWRNPRPVVKKQQELL